MKLYSKLLSIIVAVLMTAIAPSAYARYVAVPNDTAVYIDKLPNGLTVYLRHNTEPAGQVDFYLVQSVGSVNENDNQRGLAHFLEHMCFNGTKHFPGNSLIDYLESIGVKFGANLNAYTSTDETVYNICAVPAQRTTALDSCLLILRDWSHDLLLNDADIDAERGVIEGEWRQRQGNANARLLEKAVEKMYPGSPYGQRMPIGLMDVVRNFDPDVLRAYYHEWYNPVNQCVVVVGDIDVKRMAAKIGELWSDVPYDPSWKVSPRLNVPANENVIAVVESDPEQNASLIQVYIKHDDISDEDSRTIVRMRRDVASSMAMSMLAERFDEIQQSDDAPFTNLGIGDRNFVMARVQPAVFMRVVPKPGREKDVIALINTELQRVSRHGFTQSEFVRAQADERSENNNAYAASSKQTNTQRATKYVRHFLDGGLLPSDDAEYKMKKGVIGTMTVDSVNAYIRSVVPADGRNVVLVAYMPQTSKLTADDLTQAWNGVSADEITPYVDKFLNRPLMTATPVPGSIVSEDADSVYGAKIWKLANGITVYVKKTDFEPGKVIIQGRRDGGQSVGYDPSLAAEYHLLNDALAVSALGDNSRSDVRRIMAGKSVKTQLEIEKMDETLAARAVSTDITEALQLLHLAATSLKKDDEAFARLLQAKRVKLDSNAGNPTNIMGDSIHLNVFNHHPLGAHLSADEIDRVSYDKIMKLYNDRFSDCSGFNFYIVGDFDEDKLKNDVCTYLGSLPGNGRESKAMDVGFGYSDTMTKEWTTPMQIPQTICYSFYHVPCEFTPENLANARVLSRVYSTLLRKDLREERGWTYGIQTHIGLTGAINGNDPSNAIMPVYVKVAPENADSTFTIVNNTAMAMADPANVPADLVASVKESLLKDMTEAQTSNAFFVSLMYNRCKYGVDMNGPFIEAVKAVTPQSVADFAARTLVAAKRLQLRMAPAD